MRRIGHRALDSGMSLAQRSLNFRAVPDTTRADDLSDLLTTHPATAWYAIRHKMQNETGEPDHSSRQQVGQHQGIEIDAVATGLLLDVAEAILESPLPSVPGWPIDGHEGGRVRQWWMHVPVRWSLTHTPLISSTQSSAALWSES